LSHIFHFTLFLSVFRKIQDIVIACPPSFSHRMSKALQFSKFSGIAVFRIFIFAFHEAEKESI
jgi:hypothetical protein